MTSPLPPTPIHELEVRRVWEAGGGERKAQILEDLLRRKADDPGWIVGFLAALGPESLGEALTALDPFDAHRSGPSTTEVSRAALLLGEAARRLEPAGLARLIVAAGGGVLANLIEAGLLQAGNPFAIGAESFGEHFEALAQGLGRLAADLGVEQPSLASLLEALGEGGYHGIAGAGQPRLELAAWLVARSGHALLQAHFVEILVDGYHPHTPRGEIAARAAAVVMAALEPASAVAACLVRLEGEARRSLVADALRPGDGCLGGLPLGSVEFGVDREIRRDLARFVGKLTGLEPSLLDSSEGFAAWLGGDLLAGQGPTCGWPRPGAPGS
ncbi:MAG TPA: hypothetical protein VF017_00515 [Thermoanaerobaculia bacterium]|nr:hypothetical protein [Thermoanaerobaculia bacterium]